MSQSESEPIEMSRSGNEPIGKWANRKVSQWANEPTKSEPIQKGAQGADPKKELMSQKEKREPIQSEYLLHYLGTLGAPTAVGNGDESASDKTGHRKKSGVQKLQNMTHVEEEQICFGN